MATSCENEDSQMAQRPPQTVDRLNRCGENEWGRVSLLSLYLCIKKNFH